MCVRVKGKTRKSTLWHSVVIAVRLFFTSKTQVLRHVAQLPFNRTTWEFSTNGLGRDLRANVWPISSFIFLHMPGLRSRSEKKDGVLCSPAACTQLYYIRQYTQFSCLNIPIVLSGKEHSFISLESLLHLVCVLWGCEILGPGAQRLVTLETFTYAEGSIGMRELESWKLSSHFPAEVHTV